VELMGKEKGYNSSYVRKLTSPLFEETLGAFLFLPIFSFSVFSIHFLSLSFLFSILHLFGFLIIFEEKNHFFKNFFPNEMVWS
jgi:hypothetical protein